MGMPRTLTVLPGTYAMCRLSPDDAVPAWALAPADFVSVTRSRSELSIICPAGIIPVDMPSQGGWHCLRIDGQSGLDEPGVLVSAAAPLSETGLSVFAVASYDTDHLLVRDLDRAIAALRAAGHHVNPAP
jgi:hypothetical protein